MSVESIMGAMFNVGVPLAILAAVFGFRWREGLWGNTISAFCVLLSILFAVAWWETVAGLICQASVSMLFLSDLVAVWLVFLTSLAILNELTRALSRVKVLFLLPVEAVGNFLALCVLYILLLNFFLFTTDLAPIGANAEETTSADSLLIATCRLLSKGTLEAIVDPHPFDPHGELRTDHLSRRKELMKYALSKEGSLFYEGSIPPRKKE